MIKKVFSLLFSIMMILSITLNIKVNAREFNSPCTKEFNWYYSFNKEEGVPHGPKETPYISNHKVVYCGDTSKKEIFLTFDEGYENGNTAKILDILKENQVPAAFFVTRPYIKDYPDLIKRMDEEGHLVCNHTSHHPSMAKILDKEKFTKEFTEVEEEYSKVTGKEMPKFFRPPMGKYSEQSLAYTEELGYTSVFWSFAYKDWLVDDQPSKEAAKKKILDKVHNGEVALLHAVSDTNTAILDEILKELKSNGYEFKSLNDLTPKQE
ncbi:MAG: delta-lactam-biosynthetic de-N-acetylase [Clostridium perfringens]|nr:delta-lactam-biosynthetic de-N-acetylase [Clostridium perfringens]